MSFTRISTKTKTQLGAALLLTLGIAQAARAQDSFGMTATVIGTKEIAGTDSSQHVCQILVKFQGGHADVVQSHYSDHYTWSFSSPYGGGGVTNGTVIALTFPGNTTLSPAFSGTLYGHRVEAGEYWDATNQVWIGWGDVWDQNVVYNPFRLRQFPVDTVAIDSRKTYAPPNKDGAYPAADANADPRNVAFAGWAYRGGLFVGNANGVNGDQSGVARIQFQATDPGGLPSCIYTMAMLHIGTPAFFKTASTQWNGALALNAYVPSGTPTANTPISNITWANAMVPATSTNCGSLDVTSAPANEYINLTISTGFPYRLLMTATDETATRWRYFAGSTYTPSSPTYPYSECKTHLWGTDVPTPSGGTLVHTSHSGGTSGGSGGGGTTPPGGGTTPPGGGTTPPVTDPGTPVTPVTPKEKTVPTSQTQKAVPAKAKPKTAAKKKKTPAKKRGVK